MTMEVDFSGLDQLTQRLSDMSNRSDVEKKALDTAADHIQKELESAAPVLSGTLKENILKTEVNGGKIDIGTRPVGDGFYGFFLEYGTSKMGARPWARPAWERNKRKVKQIMADELRKGMGL